MVGQDEILFKQDRKYFLRSLTECSTMKFEKEVFEKILKDFPDIQFKLLEEADFRQKAAQGDDQALNAKKILMQQGIKIFNELARDIGYKS